jgi:hypothetical protein
MSNRASRNTLLAVSRAVAKIALDYEWPPVRKKESV